MAAVYLDQFRVMQRPRSRTTRGAAAAAEIEHWGVRGGRRGTEESDEGLWAGPIYKGRLVNGREKRGGRRRDYLAAGTPRFSGWSLKDKIRWDMTE